MDAVLSPQRGLLIAAARMQARGGPNAELARQVILFVLFAELLAAAGHDGPPHRSWGPPSGGPAPRQRRRFRASLTGRRPRG